MDNGTLRVLGREDNDLSYLVEIETMRGGVNRNKWDYRNIRRHADTFKGVPILTAYVGGRIGDGHNMDEMKDPETGETYYSTMGPTAERIVGAVGESPEDVRVEERDGQEWIIVRGKLWRFYHRELVDKIAKQGQMAVSAETEVFDEKQDGDISIFSDWRALGITILGDRVNPAVPGANVKAMSEIGAVFEKMKIRAAQEEKAAQACPKENLQKGMNRRMNKKQMLELEKRFGDGVKVLAGDEKHVVLLKNNEPMAYAFGDEKDTIVPEHFDRISLNAAHTFADGVTVDVDLNEYTAALAMNADNAEKRADAEKLRADKAEERVTAMLAAEKTRRVEAVKKALQAKAAEIKADLCDDGCDADCEELCGQAESFAGDCNTAEWNGEKEACDKLLAKCSERFMANKRKMKAMEKKTIAWDIQNKDNTGADGLNGAIERILGK